MLGWMHVAAAALLCACTAAASASAAELETRLAKADSAHGEKIFRKCAGCHTIEKGGRNKIGPNLWGIVGAPVGVRDGFRYSRAMSVFDGSWTPDLLDAYLAKPSGLIKGGSMNFVGLKREQDRADIIAFLNRMTDTPIDFGSAQEALTDFPQPEPEDFGTMVAGPGASETFDACTSCHSERIVVQQGLTREHWNELLDWMAEEQEMEPIKGEARTIILDYLSTHYGPDRPNFPRN